MTEPGTDRIKTATGETVHHEGTDIILKNGYRDSITGMNAYK